MKYSAGSPPGNTCLMCGNKCGSSIFCRKCERNKRKSSALLYQNTVKLRKLLKSKGLSCTGFKKFLLYTGNITKNGKELMKYKSCEELKNLIVINNLK